MSVYTFTIDHLMQLDKPALEYALRIFEKELDGALDLLHTLPEARQDEVVLNDLAHALTLRKVVARRLEELTQEATPQLLLTESSIALASAA